MRKTIGCWFLLWLIIPGLGSCKTTTQKLDWNKIIKKYSKNKADSLYLQAALFLRTNMNNQFTERIGYSQANTGKEKQFQPEQIADSSFLSTDLLEKNIEQAVESWKTYSPYSHAAWQLFLEYVLPYKIINEYPEEWREPVRKKYDPIISHIQKDSLYQVHVIDTINNDIKKWFRFNLHTSPRTWAALSASKNGDCVAISTLLSFAGRSYGIPVAIDYCPVWANINGSTHYWNSILNANKLCIPFMGAETNPPDYNPFLLFKSLLPDGDKSTFKKCAKVFRQTFTINKNNIRRWIKNDADIPYTLSEDRYADVTSEYYPVRNISIKVPFSTKHKIAYLCVFNKGEWVPTAWDTIGTNQNMVFTNMATDQLYLPAYFINGQVIPFNYPIQQNDSTITNLVPDKNNNVTIRIKYLQSVEQEQIDLYSLVNKMEWKDFEQMQYQLAAGKNRSIVQKGQRYTLYYWDKQWIAASTTTCTNDYVYFKNVPGKCLYKVTTGSSSNKERVFTCDKGTQRWW